MNKHNSTTGVSESEWRAWFSQRWQEPAASFWYTRKKFLVYVPGRITTINWNPGKIIGSIIFFPLILIWLVATYIVDFFKPEPAEGPHKSATENPATSGTIRVSSSDKQAHSLKAVASLKMTRKPILVLFSRSHLALYSATGIRRRYQIVWENTPELRIETGPAEGQRLDIRGPKQEKLSFYLNDEQYHVVVQHLGPQIDKKTGPSHG